MQVEEINAAVNERVSFERQQFSPEPEPDFDDADGPGAGQENAFSSKEIMGALARNEDGDAELFIQLHRGQFVYDHSAATWYYWAKHHWKLDTTEEALAGISAVVEIYAQEALIRAWNKIKATQAGNETEAEKHTVAEKLLNSRIKKLREMKRKTPVLHLARAGANSLGISGNEWDKDPWLLAVQNGVIDLKTGILRPGKPEDFIKTAAPTAWQGLDAPCPIWEKFLVDIFGGDKQLITFVQRLLGYGVTGLAILHIFIILWGMGRNGKGTLLETLKTVLGEFALKTESELLLEQKQARQAGAPNSSVLSLRGKRIVWASETSDGKRLNVGGLKELVGGDTLNARPLFGKHHIQFAPSHLLLLLTNSKPVAPAGDYALWQRVHLIPFEQAFIDNPKALNESKADPYLLDKLKAEASGILAWLVRGCLAWQKKGLNPPDTVRAATQEYKNDEDTLGHFIEEGCILGEACHVRAGELYQAWKLWAEANGSTYLSGKIFGMEIRRRGFSSYHDKQGTFYLGVGLKVTGDGCDG